MIFTSSKTKFRRNIVIYDTLIYFIYHIHDSFGEWQGSCSENRILRPEISTCTASSRVGSRTKAGQTRQTRQMFLVEEEFLTKSNMYTWYVTDWNCYSFFFVHKKKLFYATEKFLAKKNNHTIIHNLVRHSTEMKITSIAPNKTPLGPCSQRVAASCVAREPQHQQNINKSSPSSPVASGFSMLRVWWRIGKPKAKVLPLLESWAIFMS